jgi:hypothetical protein
MTHDRVVAWFVTVVNPILDGLRPIEHYLVKGRWTWRYATGFFEVLYPAAALVSIRYHANLEDFFEENPDFRKLAGRYDAALRSLAAACQEAHSSLIADAGFRLAVDAADTEYPQAIARHPQPGRFAREWWGALPQAERAHPVAEHVVNNLDDDVYDGSTDALFWNTFRSRFLEFRDRERHRDRFHEMRSSGDEALASGRELSTALKSMRSQLAKQHGVPPVPLY